jgi:hypothetical protein
LNPLLIGKGSVSKKFLSRITSVMVIPLSNALGRGR